MIRKKPYASPLRDKSDEGKMITILNSIRPRVCFLPLQSESSKDINIKVEIRWETGRCVA